MKYSILIVLCMLVMQGYCQGPFTWQHTNGPEGSGISSIYTNDEFAFIPSHDYLYRSSNGINWEKINYPGSSYMAVYQDTVVFFKYDTAQRKLILHLSFDNGISWNRKDAPFHTDDFISVAQGSEGLYWMTWDTTVLFRSQDLGDTWQTMALPELLSYPRMKGFDDHVFVFGDASLYLLDTFGQPLKNISPSIISGQEIVDLVAADSQIVFQTTAALLNSHDLGSSWSSIPASHSSTFTLALVDDQVYAVCNDELLRSDDFGTHWDTLSGGMTDFNLFKPAGFQNTFLCSSYRKGIFRWDETQQKLLESNEGLGKGYINQLAAQGDQIWAACDNGIFSYDIPTSTWSDHLNFPFSKYGYRYVATNESGWIVTSLARDTIIYFSEDSGDSWKTIPVSIEGVEDIMQVQIIGDVMFMFAGWRIYRSADRGLHWAYVTEGGYDHKIIVFGNRYFVVQYGHLYASDDNGITWEEMVNLPINIYELSVFENQLYALTQNQQVSEIYSSPDALQWTYMGNDFPIGYWPAELGYQACFFFRDDAHHYSFCGWLGHFSNNEELTGWTSLPTTKFGRTYVVHDDVVYLGTDGMYKSEIENPYVPTSIISPSPTKPLFSIFPNPANDEIQIFLSADDFTKGQLAILAIDGKSIFSKPISSVDQRIELDVSQFPPGIYIVQLSTAVKTSTQRFYKTD